MNFCCCQIYLFNINFACKVHFHKTVYLHRMTDSAATPNEHSRCAECDKPASFRCSRCQEDLDTQGEPSPTFYCGKTWQESNWKIHKTVCKHANYRKQLYRAGTLVQNAFHSTHQESFDSKVAKIVKQSERPQASHGKSDNEESFLVCFTETMFENEQQKRLLLSWYSCNEAVARMSKLVTAALEGTLAFP